VGHARDEEAKAKHCSQNIAGMARSYGVIVLNLMAVRGGFTPALLGHGVIRATARDCLYRDHGHRYLKAIVLQLFSHN